MNNTMQVKGLAKVLLETLQKSDHPMSRKEIAAAIGRPGILTPHDVKTLKDLESEGFISIENVETGPARTEYRYKVSDAHVS